MLNHWFTHCKAVEVLQSSLKCQQSIVSKMNNMSHAYGYYSCEWLKKNKKRILESIMELTIAICYDQSIQQSIHMRIFLISHRKSVYHTRTLPITWWVFNCDCLSEFISPAPTPIKIPKRTKSSQFRKRRSRQLLELELCEIPDFLYRALTLVEQRPSSNLDVPNFEFSRGFHWLNLDYVPTLPKLLLRAGKKARHKQMLSPGTRKGLSSNKRGITKTQTGPPIQAGTHKFMLWPTEIYATECQSLLI